MVRLGAVSDAADVPAQQQPNSLGLLRVNEKAKEASKKENGRKSKKHKVQGE